MTRRVCAESHRRADVVANRIDPVRSLIAQSIAIEERHFRPIVGVSPFVSRLQAPLYALGFARFFQGDFASAAYLLIPQLEASLRHILKARGADPTKRRDDATEEDRSLDAIIANHRSDLLEMMGEPLLDELNRIFNLQPGPTLRHDVAHGQLSEGQCYSADVIYACWLLYRVCCLPLLTRWDDSYVPAMRSRSRGGSATRVRRGARADGSIGPLRALGEVRQRGGKRVIAFVGEAEFEAAKLSRNNFEIEWPPKSGRSQAFP